MNVNTKHIILPIILLASIAAIPLAFADSNSNSNTNTNANSNGNSNVVTSTQSSSINGQGTVTTSTSHDGGPMVTHTHEFTDHQHHQFFHTHPHVVIIHEPSHTIVVHRTIVNHQAHFSTASNQNVPIVFVKGAGFVAPINCKLNSQGDKIVCDFEQVQIN